MLAMDVFGLDCLAKSSVGGGRSWNSDVTHLPLDAVKTKFLRGTFCSSCTRIPFVNSLILMLSCIIFIIDLFAQRIGSNTVRASKFTRMLNKHCGNARQ